MAIVSTYNSILSIGELVISSASIEDAENLISYIKQVECETDFLIREANEFDMTLENEKQFIERITKSNKEILLTAKVNGNLVGTLGCSSSSFNRYKHQARFGISILKDYFGYGIGSKMMQLFIGWADEMGMSKLTLEVDTNNERAIALYKKFGFENEGILKYDRYMGNGIYRDSLIMARINYNNLHSI